MGLHDISSRFLAWPVLIFMLATGHAAGVAAGADWGQLSGTFTLRGAAPPRQPLTLTRDQEYCGRCKLLDETLVVNEENGGIANVVVYLYLDRDAPPPAVHPSYRATDAEQVLLRNRHCRFDPHVTLLRTTQSLVISADDPFAANAKIDTFNNPRANVVIPSGTQLELRLPHTERVPSQVSCPVHGWESGWIVIKDHPYIAVTDENGKFAIKDLPVGRHDFQFWHERVGYIRTFTMQGRETNPAKGRLAVEIQPGDNDLGKIELEPALLAK